MGWLQIIPKIFLLLLLSAIFISCKQNAGENKTVSGPKKVAPNKEKSRLIKTPDTVLNSTHIEVDGNRFVLTCTSAYKFFVQNEQGDTVYQDSVYSPHQEIFDFNDDHYKDIVIEYMTNVPGIVDILLYDKSEKTFKQVVDLQRFPAPQRIANTNYYYSYHRSGCADMNWDSDLFYIENYKAIKIGNINGHQCDDRDKKDGIYISKIVGKSEIVIDHLPIQTIKSYRDYKWGFINQYWQRNYRRFL